eukprot:TRINITY_DN7489_c0_g1_i3.p1 TRINITY_DN7489_c0_g1~~TRINITY_DN7489_c0_g1_i3.p1  ORF type:complete len:275 (+),score=12.22 TRINITY_DN7489_c0_g1_i3:82-825(+)
MEAFAELVLAASSLEGSVIAWELETGKLGATYKPTSSPRNGLCAIGRDYFAASQGPKVPVINLWQWPKATSNPMSIPHAVGPLASTSDGTHLVGGGRSGHLFLWEVSTGAMLKSWPAHSRPVTSVLFSDDSSFLVSAGEDGQIVVMELARVLDTCRLSRAHDLPEPYCQWKDHSQPVTGLFVGSGDGNAVVVSCSTDHTCKALELVKGLAMSRHSSNGERVANATDGRVLRTPTLPMCTPHAFAPLE